MFTKNKIWEAGFFIAILAITIFFSFYKLSESPPVWYDEGFYEQTAWQVSQTGTQGLQVSPDEVVSASHVTVGYPVIYPLSFVFSHFGYGLTQGRVLMAIFLILCVIVSYFLVRIEYGPKWAIASGFLLATFPILYGNGKSILGEVPGLFFLVLFFLFWDYSIKETRGQTFNYLLCGVLAGLAIASKPIFILLLPALVLTFILLKKEVRFKPLQFIFAILGFVTSQAVWVFTQFERGDSLSQVISYYANPYSYQNLSTIITQNIARFFTESTPIYALLLFMIWFIALLIRFIKKQKPHFIEITAFLFSALVIASYLRTPGWYRYLFPAMVVCILYLPSSLGFLSEYFSNFIKNKKIFQRLSVVFIVLLVLIQFYQLGFSSWVADHYESTHTKELSDYFLGLPNQTSFYLYDVPELAIFLPNKNYYQYIKPVNGTIQIGKDTLSAIDSGLPDIVVAKTVDLENKTYNFDKYKVRNVLGGYSVLTKLKP